jgi:hypothetical protein
MYVTSTFLGFTDENKPELYLRIQLVPRSPSTIQIKVKVKVKVKQSRYRPGVAQRVPGS